MNLLTHMRNMTFFFLMCSITFLNNAAEPPPPSTTPRMHMQPIFDMSEQALKMWLQTVSTTIDKPPESFSFPTPTGNATITLPGITHQPNPELVATAKILADRASYQAQFWRTWRPGGVLETLLDYEAGNPQHQERLAQQLYKYSDTFKAQVYTSLWNSIRWYHVAGVVAGCALVGYIMYKIVKKAVRDGCLEAQAKLAEQKVETGGLG